MRRIHSLRLAFLVAVVAITGCANQPTDSESEPEVNVLEIQQQAAAAYESQDWQAAEKYYLQLVTKVPKDVEAWFRLGNIYARLNQADTAVLAYREALIRDSKNAKAWNNMGVMQLRQAANTFRELHDNTDDDNPLHERGKRLFDALMELLDHGPTGMGTDTR